MFFTGWMLYYFEPYGGICPDWQTRRLFSEIFLKTYHINPNNIR